MTDDLYEQLLTDIHNGDFLAAEWKYEYPKATRTAEQQRDMDKLAADLSYMRGRKHHHELKMLAATTGSTLPEYDSAALTKPMGDRIRVQMEELRQHRVMAWPTG